MKHIEAVLYDVEGEVMARTDIDPPTLDVDNGTPRIVYGPIVFSPLHSGWADRLSILVDGEEWSRHDVGSGPRVDVLATLDITGITVEFEPSELGIVSATAVAEHLSATLPEPEDEPEGEPAWPTDKVIRLRRPS